MKGGNPTWVKGKSPNPKGRPRGQTSLEAFHRDPDLFLIHHLRWERFCWGLMEPPCTRAAAARRAGYSPKSARFIASRLWKKPVIREVFRALRDLVNSSRIYQDPFTGKRTIIRPQKNMIKVNILSNKTQIKQETAILIKPRNKVSIEEGFPNDL